MVPRRFSTTQESLICQRYQQGESLAGLGRSFGAAVSTIALVLERHGIRRRPARAPKGSRILGPLQEGEICERYLTGESAPMLARDYAVNPSTVRGVLGRHGIRMRGNVLRFTEAQEAEMLARYNEGATLRQLGADYGAGKKTIAQRLRKSGATMRSHSEASQRLECDRGFFDCVDTEAQAYWLGFLAADGNVVGDILQVTLAVRDRDHLERFRADLGSAHVIQVLAGSTAGSAGLVKLAIWSQQLCTGLAKHGVHPKKTFTLRWPTFLSDDLLRHYLRGSVDGDGGFYAYSARSGGKLSKTAINLLFQLTSNEQVCQGAQDYLVRTAGVNRTKLVRHTRNPLTVSLKYGAVDQVSRIYHLLYDDASVYLPRKREVVRTYVRSGSSRS